MREPWDHHINDVLTLKGFANRRTLSGFNNKFFNRFPGLSLRSNPGLKFANAFGVIVVKFQTEALLMVDHPLPLY